MGYAQAGYAGVIIIQGNWRITVSGDSRSRTNRGFIELLKQLTTCDYVSDKDFEARFQELSSLGDDHVICVIEDAASGKIIATGSVFIEKKFIRSWGMVGHIEDVAIDSNARGLNLGKRVVSFLMDHVQSVIAQGDPRLLHG